MIATETEEKAGKPVTKEGAAIDKMAKYGVKVRKMLMLAFDVTADEGEAQAAFTQARLFMKKIGVTMQEMIRPDWGAGPLLVALQRVGHTVMPSGTYQGKTLNYVIDVEPSYVVSINSSGGFRSAEINSAIALVADAYIRQMFCQFSGEWE